MSDLIKRSDAIKATDECFALLARLRATARRALETVPSADRPQGEWVFDDNGYFYCSECNRKPKDQTMTTDYCPSCGARMKGADDDN